MERGGGASNQQATSRRRGKRPDLETEEVRVPTPRSLAGTIRRRAAKAEQPARTKAARRVLRPKQGGDDRLQGSVVFRSELGRLETPKSNTSSGAGPAPSLDGCTRGRDLRPRPPRGTGGTKRSKGPAELPALRRGSGTTPRQEKENRPQVSGRRYPVCTGGVGEGEGRRLPTVGGRGGEHSSQAPAGTWEGAERSGVGAQGPVAHSRNELQAEDLLQEPGRPLAAAAPLVLHPAAIHRRGMELSVRRVAVARSHGTLGSPFVCRLSVTFGQGPLPPTPTALSSDGPFLQSERAADGGGGARVVPAPHVA